eukprot:scaffold300_cov258-Pinguiococcus_pyrenoidosus.AAC.3
MSLPATPRSPPVPPTPRQGLGCPWRGESGIDVIETERGVPSGRKSCAVEYNRAYQLHVVLTYLVSFHIQRQGDR